MTIARLILLAALLAPTAALALDDPPCLSQNEVQGGYKRYHIIGGRQCWYAASVPVAKPAQPAPSPGDQTASTEVNPYGDPIWDQAAPKSPPKPRAAKPSAVGGPLILNPASSFAR